VVDVSVFSEVLEMLSVDSCPEDVENAENGGKVDIPPALTHTVPIL